MSLRSEVLAGTPAVWAGRRGWRFDRWVRMRARCVPVERDVTRRGDPLHAGSVRRGREGTCKRRRGIPVDVLHGRTLLQTLRASSSLLPLMRRSIAGLRSAARSCRGIRGPLRGVAGLDSLTSGTSLQVRRRPPRWAGARLYLVKMPLVGAFRSHDSRTAPCVGWHLRILFPTAGVACDGSGCVGPIGDGPSGRAVARSGGRVPEDQHQSSFACPPGEGDGC